MTQVLRYFITFCFTGMLMLPVKSQYFSENEAEFFTQALTVINNRGTEAATKVAYDFTEAWRGNFTNDHRKKIISIAIQMEKKGYYEYPHFWYYFTYLAYANSQAHLDRAQLSDLLDINDQMVKSMKQEEYSNFLLGLSMFMARKILGQTKHVRMTVDNGTYQFKVIEAAPVEEQEHESEEDLFPPPIEETEEVTEYGTGDGFNTDASFDAWGAVDDWASGTSFGNTSDWDDSWRSENNSGAINTVTPDNQPKREVVVGVTHNYLAEKRLRYNHPVVQGPVIDLLNNGMVIATPYDSLLIKEMSGYFLLKNRVLAGTRAVINWPQQNKQFAGAVVTLGEFQIKADRSDFWTPNASITFPSLAKPVEGVFTFRSVPRKSRDLSPEPTFTSNHADVKWNFPGGKMNYTGGVKLSGNRLYGTSISRELGELQILDGKGNTVVVRSRDFIFEDSVVTCESGKLSILHGSDSLTHPAVNLRYDQRSDKLVLYRTKEYNVTPFHSSYFDMNLNVDLIKWDMNTDSLDLSILNGKEWVVATAESDQYFNEERFRKLGGMFQFHPIVTTVYYARKYGIKEFNQEEIANEFKVGLNQVKGAMNLLKQYGFAEYNPDGGQVKLNDRAFHYYDAATKKADFDNLKIPSLKSDVANMTWNIKEGEILVRGVQKFYMTSDYDVKVEPDSSVVTILKGRDLRFNGMIAAGDFQYKGKDFNFVYDEFLIQMPNIDSIRIDIPVPDSLKAEGGPEKSGLSNHLNETSGTLYIDKPENKSGVIENNSYPYLLTDGESVVYFDGPEVLNGAYDKSVKFVVPPFEMDSTERKDGGTITFEGKFNSGGIFPTFDETLHIMPDQSLGFEHQIPAEGYNLYGTEAKTYEKITLSNKGIRGGGKIDFITSTIYSDDFIYYPDSVKSFGSGGQISPGTVDGASYPEAVLGPFQMDWLPRKDSMYLQNIGEPFQFYQRTATLDGEANITSKGVFGSGVLETRGSRSRSNALSFKENSYSARHAHFEVFSKSATNPAMLGDDVRLDFDLIKNEATIRPEVSGVAAVSFPYAQMKTSINNAVWDLEDSVVTMTKPDNVPLEDSYFYTTRKELDSLAFYGTEAVYDINTYELQIKGIPYITVADARIIPENNQTTILEYAELQPFNNARIIIDTLNGYHHFKDGNIKILSRNKFEGSAIYELVALGDTFDIVFDQFELDNVKIGEKEKRLMTVSQGAVAEEQNLIISPGFFYKGSVKMYAYKQALELDGAVKIDLKRPGYDKWIEYERTDEETAIKIDFERAQFDDKTPLIAGLHFDLRGKLYTTFIEERKAPSDEDFFYPKGLLGYDTTHNYFKIETPAKSSGDSYSGYTLTYDVDSKDVIFEGKVNFFNSITKDVVIDATVLGVGNAEENSYQADAFMTVSAANIDGFLGIMANDLVDMATRLGFSPANDLSLEMLYKLANMSTDAAAKKYETESLKDYVPLYDLSENLLKPLVISGVKLKWSDEHGAWYNTSKIGISNVMKTDVNSKFDGFMEFRKDAANNDVMNIFIQAAPGLWYYISYQAGTLLLYSSNSDFNRTVSSKSNYGQAKPGEMVIIEGDVPETLKFVNDFRQKYYNITTPYNLKVPGDLSFDQGDNTEPAQKKDDGFGF
ncbi:MAG: hypothetical protein ACFHWX_20220 [Bacteroidota bacterium]